MYHFCYSGRVRFVLGAFHSDSTQRLGIAFCDYAITEMGFIFREQPIRDYGIDAQIEIYDNDYATGNLIAAQIKTGLSYFH